MSPGLTARRCPREHGGILLRHGYHHPGHRRPHRARHQMATDVGPYAASGMAGGQWMATIVALKTT
jgi:hypothetical protein